MQDICKQQGKTEVIADHDNLKGLGEAINAVFPKTKQQLCIVHQSRNSTKFVQYKDRKEICADLKKIYGAVNLDDAEYTKDEFREKWDKKYPSILRSWMRIGQSLPHSLIIPSKSGIFIQQTQWKHTTEWCGNLRRRNPFSPPMTQFGKWYSFRLRKSQKSGRIRQGTGHGIQPDYDILCRQVITKCLDDYSIYTKEYSHPITLTRVLVSPAVLLYSRRRLPITFKRPQHGQGLCSSLLTKNTFFGVFN